MASNVPSRFGRSVDVRVAYVGVRLAAKAARRRCGARMRRTHAVMGDRVGTPRGPAWV